MPGLYLMQRSVPATLRNEVRVGASVQTQSAAEGEPELRVGLGCLDGLLRPHDSECRQQAWCRDCRERVI